MNTIQVRNPRTGENDYSFEATKADEISSIVSELRQNQASWAAKSIDERADVLDQWAKMVAESGELLDALIADTGRYFICTGEVAQMTKMVPGWRAIGNRVFSEQEPLQSSVPTVTYTHQYKAFEVVGIIGPWNFPFLITLIDLIPALMAGSTVIVKPSEITPRFIKPIQDIIQKIPELHKVCRFVQGGGQTGQDLIDNVDALCFTGSVKTGKLVYESGARNFIPVYAELGGKDPVIVTENADPLESARIILRASVQATGQACQSIERVYVHQSIADQLIESLVEQASKVTLNYPDVRKGHIGPLIFDKQADIIADHLEDAKEKGATILTGGEIEDHGGGKWVKPTVIKGETEWYDILLAVQEAMTPYARRGIHANVDFFAGAVYYLLGIPSDLFVPIFAVGRIPGWTIQILEQMRHNILIRPLLQYTGERSKEYIPIDKRD